MLKEFKGFDHKDVLKPGTPIRVRHTHSDENYYALIVASNQIKIVVVRSWDFKARSETIHLSDVQGGKYKIEPLVFEEVDGGEPDVKATD